MQSASLTMYRIRMIGMNQSSELAQPHGGNQSQCANIFFNLFFNLRKEAVILIVRSVDPLISVLHKASLHICSFVFFHLVNSQRKN